MASKIKKQVQDELLNVMELLDEGSTKYNLLEGLYNQIDKYDNDKDIVNTVWANKDLPLRMFTVDELNMMPGFNNLLIGEPRTGKVDLEKSFGKDWVKNYENIPYNQIALVAEKNGVDPNELMYGMRDIATAQRRDDIAHGRWDPNDPWYKNVANEVGGVALDLFGKRQQEAIARGKDPSGQDYALDIGQSALEAVPYGRLAKLAKVPTIGNALAYTGSAAAAPVISEALDANLYDDSNPRGKFDPYEVGVGIGTNIVGDALLRGGGAAANRVFGGTAGTKIMHLGEGESLTSTLANDLKKVDHQLSNNELVMIHNKEGKGVGTGNYASNAQRAEALEAERNINKLKEEKRILEEVDYRYNGNKARDLAYGKGQHSNRPEHIRNQNRERAGLTDSQIRMMTNDPVLSKYLNLDVSKGLTERQLMEEAALRTLITNKYGSLQNEQGKALTRLPFGLGGIAQKAYDEYQKDEERRKLEEELYNQYKLDLLGGR